MRRLSAGDVRERFAEIVNEAAFADRRTVITRHGKEVAAIVPIADLNIAPTPRRELAAGTMAIHQTSQILTFSATQKVDVSLSLNTNGGR